MSFCIEIFSYFNECLLELSNFVNQLFLLLNWVVFEVLMKINAYSISFQPSANLLSKYWCGLGHWKIHIGQPLVFTDAANNQLAPPSAALALLKCLDVLQMFALSSAKLPCVSHIISFKLPLTIISMHARNHVQLESNATKAVCRTACNNMSVNARVHVCSAFWFWKVPVPCWNHDETGPCHPQWGSDRARIPRTAHRWIKTSLWRAHTLLPAPAKAMASSKKAINNCNLCSFTEGAAVLGAWGVWWGPSALRPNQYKTLCFTATHSHPSGTPS